MHSPYINLITTPLILNKEKILFYKRPYPISKDEFLVIKKYINKHLNKRFIYSSISLVAAPILLTKKLGGGI